MKVYILIEDGAYGTRIAGVYKNLTDAENDEEQMGGDYIIQEFEVIE